MPNRYAIVPCPVCAATEHRQIADAETVRIQAEQLWSFHMRRLRQGTPPHRLADRLAFSQKPPLRVAQCTRCTHVFRNPGEVPEVLHDTYEAEEPRPDTLQALHDAQLPASRRQASRLARHSPRIRAVLEVGSYSGSFLTAARERGWDATGVDVNAAAVEFARRRGHPVVHGTLHDHEDGVVDAVCFWNCLDQLAEPRVELAAAHQRLGTGGTVVARVPNGRFFARWTCGSGRLVSAAAIAALAHNNLLTFPYRHGFTPASLQRLLHDCGFNDVRLKGDALVPTADHWTRPWARLEEGLLKDVMRRLPPAHAPWLEAYARKA